MIFRRRRVLSLLAQAVGFACATALFGVVPVSANAESGAFACTEPAGDQGYQRAEPADLGLDPTALADALSFGARKGGFAIQVYRHGCLTADYAPDNALAAVLPTPLASSSKGVASVAVGRAITLGKFGLDDPLRTFFPQADERHGALTVRQVLNQTTGLEFSWGTDIAAITTDEVAEALHRPFAYEPGSTFQYSQSVLELLPRIVEISTGQDFQDFVQEQVMAPLGIPRDHWIWLRDRHGDTAVHGGLAMRPADFARLGQLMLQRGVWRGQRLIDDSYIRQAAEPTAANGGYGFLFWLNAGDSYKTATVPMAKVFPHNMFPGSPRDMYSFVGALGQFSVVVPSLDMVIVRTGIPGSIDLTNTQTSLAAESNPDNKELLRRITRAVTDVPAVPDDDPYRYDDSFGPLIGSPADLAAWADPTAIAAVLLGYGPGSVPDCTLISCDGRPLTADLAAQLSDTLRQVTLAALAANR
ncbi:serine hydrolase domain-containing protein [Nocardia sp. NPDC058058]|uniref:serine hydrolase domain-containing protein n=1 Tax=Nocardia sp. NPDC058058 TaxID=3346317 RepID=UPI0036DCED76